MSAHGDSMLKTYTFDPGDQPPERVRADVEAVAADHQPDGVDQWLTGSPGTVAWHPDGTAYERTPTAPPESVAAPSVVETSADDLASTAVGTLYRRFEGRYYEVDSFDGEWQDLNAVSDYFLINYGTAPYFWADSGSVALPDRRERLPWTFGAPDAAADAAPDEGRDTDRRERVRAILRDGAELDPSDPGSDTVLDDDALYHLLAPALTSQSASQRSNRWVLDHLDSDDPTLRARAVRRYVACDSRYWYLSTDADRSRERDQRLFERVLDAVLAVDDSTQRLVAPALWTPRDWFDYYQPSRAQVHAFVALLDATAPELRAAGIHAAGATLGRLVLAIRRPDQVSGDPLTDETIASTLEVFFDAYATALEDPDPLVRGRAAGLATHPLAGVEDPIVLLFEPRLWDPLDSTLRRRVERALEDRHDDAVDAVAERADSFDAYADWAERI